MTIIKPSQLKIGSKWKRDDGTSQVVTIEGFKEYGSSDPWVDVIYSWVDSDGNKHSSERDHFGFQCRYVMVEE